MPIPDFENLFLNPTLSGAPGDHGLPEGWSLAPYSHGVHYWKIPVPVEAQMEVVEGAGPDGAPALRVSHQTFKLLAPWDGYVPHPGTVRWVGISVAFAAIEPAPVDRLFRLVYHGRSDGRGYIHTRIRGERFQNDPISVGRHGEWRRIDHQFILDAGETFDEVCFHVSVSEEGDAVELAEVSLVCEGPLRPVSLKPRPRLEKPVSPDETTTIHVNPPTFIWPDEGEDARYELEIAPGRDFSRDVRRFGSISFNFFKPAGLLPPGEYLWRRRTVNGDFAEPVAFTMPEGCVEYVTPAFEDVFANLRPEHPRLFVNRDTLDTFRRDLVEHNAEAWQRFLERVDRPLPYYLDRSTNESHRVGACCHLLYNYALAFLVTGDDAHAHKAMTCLREALDVPLDGITRHRYSELNRTLVDAMAVAYDWLYDRLTDDERQRTRDALTERVRDIYTFYRHGSGPFQSMEVFRYDSHGTYMMQTILQGSLAIAGEVPEAKRWAEYWLTASISFYPPWSETDGSWAQGIHYGACYIDGNDIPEAALVRAATGLDFFEKPFFRKLRDWILYSYPPFGAKAPFGDISQKGPPDDEDLGRFGRSAHALAVAFDDGVARWYWEAAGKPKGRFRRVGPILPGIPKVASQPPDDLPLAKCFDDTGWVLMHTDLTGRDDVFCAFKSSPFGSISHSHADQNSLVVSRGDRRLLVDAGYYVGYGTPYHYGFYKHSRAHNTILVDGRGQLINASKAGGHITHFAHTDEIDYTVGDAQAAYGNLLERFDRHVVFLRPSQFIVFDDVLAAEPVTIDWLLHAVNPFEVDAQRFTARNGESRVDVRLWGPCPLEVTADVDPAPFVPERWRRRKRRGGHRKIDITPEHHLIAHAPERRRQHHFVAFIAVTEVEEDTIEPKHIGTDAWIGIEAEEGSAVFRIGEPAALTLGGREVDTDAKAVVLRPSGVWLVADATRLTIDGREVYRVDEPAKVRHGRLA